MVQSFGSMSNYRPDIGYPGMPSDIGPKYDRSYFNVAADVSQVSTVTVATYAANATYLLTINGQTASYTAPATGGSAAAVATALIEEVNLYGLGVVAQATSATAFTLTSQPGEPFTVSASTSGGGSLTNALTASSVTTGEISLGSAVLRVLTDTDREARLGAADENHTFLGVAIDPGYLTRDSASFNWKDAVYRRGDVMVVRELGRCFVKIEEDVTPSSSVFYRYTGTGTVGAFRATASTGAKQLLNARWTSSGKAGGFAELYLGAVVPSTPAP